MQVKLNLVENNYFDRKNQVVSAKDVTFGFSMPQKSLKVNGKDLLITSDLIASKLKAPTKDVITILSNASQEKFQMFHALANKYNREYFYLQDKNISESGEYVLEKFKTLAPEKMYVSIINNVKGSFNELHELLLNINNKKDAKFVTKFMQQVIGDHHYADNLLSSLMKSENKKIYMTHLEDYIPYFKLHLKDVNAVQKLDKKIADKTYDSKFYAAEYDIAKLLRLSRGPKISGFIMNKTNLKEYYSKEGVALLKEFYGRYMPTVGEKLPKESEMDVLWAYKTTNKKNVALRKSFLEHFRGNFINPKSSDDIVLDVKAMRRIFDMVDNDKHVKNFVIKSLNGDLNISRIAEYQELLGYATPKKADIFYNNFERLVNQANKSELPNAISEGLTSSTYQTPSMRLRKVYVYRFPRQRKSVMEMPKRYIQNVVNLLRYKFTQNNNVYTAASSDAAIKTLKPIVNLDITRSENPVHYSPELVSSARGLRLVSMIPNKKLKSSRIKLSEENNRTLSEILSQNLREKTLLKQQAGYAEKLTKMRLKLLPEMFASVKETAKIDRAIGRKIGVSRNSDVLNLYTRVNTKNKKLVNYMLKKRNTDNSRMFSVKDIAALIGKVEKTIQENKAINPQYKASDAKAYYGKIYNEYVNQYGKVKYSRNISNARKNVDNNAEVKVYKQAI